MLIAMEYSIKGLTTRSLDTLKEKDGQIREGKLLEATVKLYVLSIHFFDKQMKIYET